MRVVVTGSSGQIGTNLALRLQRDGHDVFGVDRRVNPWTDEFRYLLKDLTSPLEDELPACDLVVHLAAHAKVHQLVHEPHRALENAVMTFNVLELCRRRNVPIVFSSSREVYGDVHRFATEEESADFAYTESTYSASKIAGEAFVYSFARCYGLRYLVFRFSNVYGRYDNDLARMVRVIPLFTHKLGNTLVRCAELIGEALGVEPRLALAPPLVGEVTRYVADIGKARDLLGYQPLMPLEEGIPHAVEWFLANARHAEGFTDAPVPQDADFKLAGPSDGGVSVA